MILPAAIVLILLGAAYAYWEVFYAPRRRQQSAADIPKGSQYARERDRMVPLIREMEGVAFEPVTITAEDGTSLFGRYYHVRDGAPLQIQFHGYRSFAVRDFCGGNKLAREMGQNTLLVDQRAHGKSGGTAITFGIRERQDCLCWARYARQRFGRETPIFLSGASMGAATVLMASDLDLPETVIGIIADSPYSSPGAITRKVCRDRHLPVAIVWPLVRLGARLYGGFSISGGGAVEAVKHTKVPILLIHGEDDRFVPCAMSREIFDACVSPKFLATFPDAGHVLSYIVDPTRYEQVIGEFVRFCEQRVR